MQDFKVNILVDNRNKKQRDWMQLDNQFDKICFVSICGEREEIRGLQLSQQLMSWSETGGNNATDGVSRRDSVNPLVVAKWR